MSRSRMVAPAEFLPEMARTFAEWDRLNDEFGGVGSARWKAAPIGTYRLSDDQRAALDAAWERFADVRARAERAAIAADAEVEGQDALF